MKLDKTRQLHQQSDVIFVIWLIESVNRQRERYFYSFYSYALLPLNICHFERVQNKSTYFRSVENIRKYFVRFESTFKAPCTFWTRRRNMLLHFNVIVHIFDASKMTLNYSSISSRRVQNDIKL